LQVKSIYKLNPEQLLLGQGHLNVNVTVSEKGKELTLC